MKTEVCKTVLTAFLFTGLFFVTTSLHGNTITATAGPGGSISPAGEIFVNHGDNQTFIFTPDVCSQIDRVFVDGEIYPVAAVAGRYEFVNVQEDHTIHVTFKLIPKTTPITVAISCGETYDFFGRILGEPGTYHHTLTTAQGCDSTIVLNLVILGFCMIPVVDIIDVPLIAWEGTPFRLFGTVIPENAEFKIITWSIKDPGETGARLVLSNMNTLLMAESRGIVMVTATIYNGIAMGEDFVKDFEIDVKSTGLEELRGLYIYPNPTTGAFKIKNNRPNIEILEIHIYDFSRRKISSFVPQYENPDKKEIIKVDISHLPAGVYFLNMVTNRGINPRIIPAHRYKVVKY